MNAPTPASPEDIPQPLLSHVRELRRRLLVWLAFFLAFSAAAFYVFEPILNALLWPLKTATEAQGKELRLIYTGLAEAFVVQLKVALLAGFFLSFPVLLWQIWKYAKPGLFPDERKALAAALLAAPLLFLLGAGLAMLAVSPLAFSFFIGFQDLALSLPLKLEPRLSEYVGLLTSLALAFGLAFQLPLVLILLAFFGLFQAEALARKRRHAVVLIFIAAAFLTPPDVVSQLALGLPLVLLYEATILILKRVAKRPEKSYDDLSST